ncbi:MAG: protein-L-isoaspartate O-methyltransferase [Silicimonas sp.]|nr:protein-L-isoaspartate O-methyltransferase [Silicimonas sp.]
MTDFAALRTTMVDTQVRPSDVTKFPIIEAMLSVPREGFVPQDRRAAAYAGEQIELDTNRVLLDPRLMGKMLDAVDIQGDELVLDIGPGLGYSSALVARMAEAVVAVEENPDLAQEAERALAEISADNVALIEGALVEGADKHGPYDVILLQGAVQKIPESLIAQLKDGGRIAALFADGSHGEMRLGYKAEGKVSWRFMFNGSAPVLPGFEQERSFAL